MAKKKPIRDSFLWYRSFYEATKNMDLEALGRLYIAINEYGLNQKIVEMDDSIYPIFTLIKPQIDANYRKWLNGCMGGPKKGTVNNPSGINQYKGKTVPDLDLMIGIPEDNQRITKGIPNVNENEKCTNVNEECINVNENILPSSLKGNLVISLPLNVKNTFKDIYEEDLTYYSGIYPNVDILQEFRNMVGWLNANPTKKKTAKGIDKFINNWLCSNQDQGGRYQRTRNGSAFNGSGTMSIEDMQRMKGSILND